MIVQHINGKQKNLHNEQMVDKFLLQFENGNEESIRKIMFRCFANGDTVYYAMNPFAAEMENKKEIIIGKNEEEVRNTFHTLQEEV